MYLALFPSSQMVFNLEGYSRKWNSQSEKFHLFWKKNAFFSYPVLKDQGYFSFALMGFLALEVVAVHWESADSLEHQANAFQTF